MLVIGDLEIDTSNKEKGNGNYFSDLCDSFTLKDLMTDITWIESINGFSIDVLLTNKMKSCYHTAFESGLGDCHKMILAFFRVHFEKLLYKNIEYQKFKSFYKDNFLHVLDFELSKGTIYKFKDNQYGTLTSI